MRFVDLIVKKREGHALTTDEINWWIRDYTIGKIPDYQVSALLMAIVFNGMNARETSDLTMAMMHSGDVLNLDCIPGIKADKHSTGGVGDKTSLTLSPLIAACGVKVAKMSGRGLGYTGGTLDKLESILGYNCFIDEQTFIRQVQEIGIAMIGQTGDLVPADKKLYALRDVTGTVDSLPLIASSIMSKKLAAGSDVISLDVKYGSGAFMKTKEDAEKLARAMINIGTAAGRSVHAMITNMELPLGRAIGNALEVKEAIDTLKGHGPEDFTELCMTAGRLMLVQAHIAKDEAEAQQMLEHAIQSGAAFEKFKQLVQAQGGDVRQIENPELLPKATYVTPMLSRQSGYICGMKAVDFGRLAMQIGAGRETIEDVIDPSAGIVLNKKTGDVVAEGEVLAWIHHNKPLEDRWIHDFYEGYEIGNQKPVRDPLIYKIL